MHKNSKFHTFIIMGLHVLFVGQGVFAQNNEIPALNNFLKIRDYVLQNEGKWIAENIQFNQQEEWSPKYYAYGFEQGINDLTILLKISGYIPKKSEWITYWSGYYAFDKAQQKVIYHSVNTEYGIAHGESLEVKDSELSLTYYIKFPNGKQERHKNILKLGESDMQSQGFVYNKKKWKAKQLLTWNKMNLPKGNLAFMSTRDGNWEIYSMDARGEQLKNLSCSKVMEYAFDFTPDGRLVYHSNKDGNEDIYIMEADGKSAKNISNHPAADRVAVVSKDGKKIVFKSNRDNENGEIYIMDIVGQHVKRLTQNQVYEDFASWSNDGSKIYFCKEEPEPKETSENQVENSEIYVIDTSGNNETRLTIKPGFDSGAEISPDGNKIAFYGRTPEGDYEIFLMNADGSNIVNLTEDPLEDYSPRWSPDGKWIAYTKGNSKNYDVWLIEVETKIKYRLTSQPKRDESPIWGPMK